jgi:hypothetical protein
MVYKTEEQIITAFTDCMGNVTHAAQALGISPQALYRRIAHNPKLSQALTHIRAGVRVVPCPNCKGRGTLIVAN